MGKSETREPLTNPLRAGAKNTKYLLRLRIWQKVESFNVIFEADAIQADGFADATAAFAAFDA